MDDIRTVRYYYCEFFFFFVVCEKDNENKNEYVTYHRRHPINVGQIECQEMIKKREMRHKHNAHNARKKKPENKKRKKQNKTVHNHLMD